jgi:glutamine amidotransferase-like uncharacterized protein
MAFEVLIFEEPGICPDSRVGLLNAFHALLTPNYWIGVVNQTQLRSGKWAHTCALLALPHCNDVEVYKRLGQDSEAIKQIRDFVQHGGSFLGIGGGAFFASTKANWTGRMAGPTPLALWPGTSTGPWSRGAHVYDFNVEIDGTPCHIYLFWEDGGEFNHVPGTSVLAQYSDGKSAAAIHSVFGKGNVVLWHARLEYALTAHEVWVRGGVSNFNNHTISVIRSLLMKGLDTEICIACRAMSP